MERRRWIVEGRVQGVGFRPFVHGLAVRCGLSGHVRNSREGVVVEAEGAPSSLDGFERDLRRLAPPLAEIQAVSRTSLPLRRERGFRILESHAGAGRGAEIAPDTATCGLCLAELRDPEDRRHRYPFLNCTRCGPRYTIVEALPYDRSRTTMAGFPMCRACREEYEDPGDRRYHAQPTACAACGPRVTLTDPAGRELHERDPIGAAAEALLEGRIVAVKGLGGFHLACDATNGEAVSRLRRRKGRDGKPFAVMVGGLEEARAICRTASEEEALLASVRRPIVLLGRRPETRIAGAVAPGLEELGLLLPYTPLHHLLLDQVGRPLVLTSGNRSGEPIVHRDEDAPSRLGAVADLFLTHDRPIHVPCDDSVVRVFEGGPLPLRRSRGYVPEAILLPRAAPAPILAVGGHLKATACLLVDRRAVLSHHVGDLDDLAGREALAGAVRHLEALLGVRPRVVAHDLHPDYASTRLARSLPGVGRVAVQHHHAHVVSCLAEHGEEGPVVGVAFDGTGAGPDGAVWGGEFLVATWSGYRRAGHLDYRRLPGGEAAVREPWRMALAHLEEALPPERREEAVSALLGTVPTARLNAVGQMIRKGTASPWTSSVGRLFDGAAALLGIRVEGVDFEAQAAMELEALADARGAEAYPVVLRDGEDGWTWDPSPLFRGLVEDRLRGVPLPRIAGAVHLTVARAVAEGAKRIRERWDVGTVALSGGVFQNRLLLERSVELLRHAGFRVLVHRRVPPNDGGLSLGQAAVAAATRLETAEEAPDAGPASRTLPAARALSSQPDGG